MIAKLMEFSTRNDPKAEDCISSDEELFGDGDPALSPVPKRVAIACSTPEPPTARRVQSLSRYHPPHSGVKDDAIDDHEVLTQHSLFAEGDSWIARNLSFLDRMVEDASTNLSPNAFFATVKHLYQRHCGIQELYEWQQECLSLPAVQERRNLIYSLPTSGGKTLVAEILIMRELICNKKDAVFVLPYVSIVQEKVRSLSPFALDLHFLVEEYAGGKGQFPPRKRRKKHVVYVATFEKAHGLVNSLIEAERLDEIGLFVVDELHMISEGGGRGATLECLLAKLMFLKSGIQIIGMSATLGNLDDLREFLLAEVYCKNFRPVALKEYVKLENQIYECTSFQLVRTLDFKYSPKMLRQDPDMLTGLLLEIIPDNSCLIFCPTKKWCENVALTLCSILPNTLCQHRFEEKKALLNALREEGAGHVCKILQRTIPYGLAYHHSGLTSDERSLIEEAYMKGTLCCLSCTSTLAAGVNLPARRVIIRSPYVGTEFLSHSRYKQMAGRAGRAGIDTCGESILVIRHDEKDKVKEMMSAPVEVCQSSLDASTDGRELAMLLLNLVELKISTSKDGILSFFEHTLFGIQSRQVGHSYKKAVASALQHLLTMKLMRQVAGNEQRLEVTKLGHACVKGSVSPERAGVLYEDLKKACKCMSLWTRLHLLYLVTPYQMMDAIPVAPDIYFKAYMSLQPQELEVASLIGVTESIIVRLFSGRISLESIQGGSVHRFFLTLMLHDLWKQTPVWDVASKYGQPRGTVQTLLTSTAAFASSVARFCEGLDEFWCLQELMPSFVKRISHCVTMELAPLMELPAVKKGRAVQLYKAGFKTLLDVAQAQPRTLVERIEHMPKRVATQIVAAAKMLVREKVEALQDEAEDLISNMVLTD